MITPHDVVQVLKAKRFHYSTEKDLQAGIERVLTDAKIPFRREAPLGDAGVIDFLIAAEIGLECKIKGSPTDVARQLLGYAAHDSIVELMLVTGRSRLADQLPKCLLDKRLTVVPLCWSFL